MNDWLSHAINMRNQIVVNDLYTTGPLSFQFASLDNDADQVEFTFYQPVNIPVTTEDDGDFKFQQELYFEDGLLIRCVELDEVEEMYSVLERAAHEFDVQLQKPYLHIYLNVYGDGFIDIYAPIVKESLHD